MNKTTIKVPHTLVLLFGMIVIAWLATLVLPAGSFESVTNEHGRAEVVPGTFAYQEDVSAPSFWSLFTVIPRGLAEAQGIIFFVFIIGGTLAVIRTTGAIDAAMGSLLRRFGTRPAMLIFIGMLAFSVGSSTIGMAEEYIPLTAVLMMLCVAMRMDVVAAISIMVVGYGVGFGTATINPFTVLVAQEVAGLPPTSGWSFRAAMLVPFFALGFWHVYRYAMRVRNDAAASLVYGIDTATPPAQVDAVQVTNTHRLVLALLGMTLVVLVWGIKQQGWYLVELGAIFFALAVVTGLIARMPLDDIANRFIVGAAELTGTALLIGFARGIELMLSDGQVLHTIINALAVPLGQIGGSFSAVGMLLIQSVLNFFVPSGSGQAYVTMPIMAPLSDIVGVSRQVAVLAYQMGDGFMNMIVPTNAVLMGILGIAGIPYGRWLRFIAPLIAQFLVLGSLTLIVAVAVGV
ncbi:MAG: TIGR00366 family protein [Pseudomonadota bacterium]